MSKRRPNVIPLTSTLVLAGLLGLMPGGAQADKGDCSQPRSTGANPVATDCLVMLNTAVGLDAIAPACIGDPNASNTTTATDALLCLNGAVGNPVTYNCPCGGRIDLEDDMFAFDPATDVLDANIRPRYVATNYIGAFPQDGDPDVDDWTKGWTIWLHGNETVWEPASGGTLNGGVPSADGSCPAGTTDIGDTPLPGGFAGTMDICQLAARYDTDASSINLTNDNIYRLGGAASQGTFIGDGDAAGIIPATAANVTLNIEPGTLILGLEAEALAITRGSQIHVAGTAADPVVMSSLTWFNDWLAGGKGDGARGEWGGLVITGFAETNSCNNMTSCDALVEGFLSPFNYGGFDDSDDSGTISYLIVRQGGFDLDGNGSELNGITLYTLGYNTEIDYVQVHDNVDDGIEFFGGINVVTHAVLTGVGDDSIDSDVGFRGGVQFALVKQDDDTADKIFESDGSVTNGATPAGTPTFANITGMGTLDNDELSPRPGLVFKDEAQGYYYNGILVDSGRSCIRGEEDITPWIGVVGDPDDGTLQIHNYVVHCPDATVGNFEGTNVEAWFNADPKNRADDPRISATGWPTSPRMFGMEYTFDNDFVLDANIKDQYVDTDYIGAFAQYDDPTVGDWTANWTIWLHGNNTVWEPASGGTLAGGTPSANGACPAGTTDIGDTALPAGFAGTMDICQLAARYSTDGSTITLTNDNVYRLGGAATQGTFIGNGDAAGRTPANSANVQLVIEPGTLILGLEAEALSITRGSQIFVGGTEEDPVVMSSLTWFNDWVAGSDGTGARGEWGGLVITGFARTNSCNNGTSCDALVEGFLNPFNYGGFDDSDDSGSISHLIIRQGGFDLDGNGSELNGLTLYTLGFNTEIDYVQVHENVDDGVEFFGGNNVVTHIALTRIGDDSIDSDLGFRGGVQFGLVVQGNDDADKVFESDGSVTNGATPAATPTFANITGIGTLSDAAGSPRSGLVFKDEAQGDYWNGVLVGSGRSCIRGEEDITAWIGDPGDPDDGTLQIHNWVVSCPDATNGTFEGTNVATWFAADPNNAEVAPELNDFGYPSPPAPDPS